MKRRWAQRRRGATRLSVAPKTETVKWGRRISDTADSLAERSQFELSGDFAGRSKRSGINAEQKKKGPSLCSVPHSIGKYYLADRNFFAGAAELYRLLKHLRHRRSRRSARS
jgi:hypothetical protein